MGKPTSESDVRGIRLEQTIRKAFADAWAQGVSSEEAEDRAVQIVRDAFPEIQESEIFSAVRAARR